MWKELCYKWFGIEELPCQNCEYLKTEIEKLQQRNDGLLNRIIGGEVKPPAQIERSEPLKPKFIPWRVKRQMLEQEDARAAQVLKQRESEIARASADKLADKTDPDVIALEKEMDIIEKEREHASEIR